MTQDVAPHIVPSAILLGLSWIISAIGIYPLTEAVNEGGNVAHPWIVVNVLFAEFAAIAPLAYSLSRLRNWRTWILILLNSPPLILVLTVAYQFATGTLR